MKIIIQLCAITLILTTTYPAFAIKIGSNQVHLLASGSADGILHYIVSKEQISDVPEWSGTGAPPMSNESASSLVLKKHKELNGEIETTIRKISLNSKETHCKPAQKCPGLLWYYKVNVRGAVRATYIVLINGDFIEPRKE